MHAEIEIFVTCFHGHPTVEDYRGTASGSGIEHLDRAIQEAHLFIARVENMKASALEHPPQPQPTPREPRVCEKCGKTLGEGEWPWCGGVNNHGYGTPFMVRDAIPGGLYVNNLGPKAVKVYSHAERLAIMKARGRREMVYHVDGDKHVSRMV